MSKVVYSPPREKLKTPKTEGNFAVGKSDKKSYYDWTKDELIAEIQRLKKRKKFGLVWEPKEEKVIEECRDKLPVLLEAKDKEIITDKNKPVNLLIEGDNFHSLSVLNYTHEKAIDVIYIDPPYNTGNKDFIFNDRFVDLEDGYRHSKWLSFMSKRLKLAKNLLKNSGVIFISIDDNEVAQLKMLMDEIFGYNNFVNTLAVQRRVKSLNVQFSQIKTLNQAFEYVLVYRKSNNFCYLNPTKPASGDRLKGYWNSFWNNADRPTMRYEIEGIKISKGQWKWSKDRAMRALNNYKEYCARYSNIELSVYWAKNKDRYFKKCGVKMEFIKPTSTTVKYWVPPSETTILDSNLMMFYVNDDTGRRKYKFETTKNLDFIKKIISISVESNAVVLDFMAGSGTTGHAVLELNKEDGGNRQFILCTNNENNICSDVCYPRIKKVITGYKDLKGRKVGGLDGNLKYFTTSFVEATATDKNKKRLTEQSTEMLCVREDTFDKVLERKDFKIFQNPRHYTCIVFNQLVIDKFKEEIKGFKKPIHSYIFSLGDEDFASEFEEMKEKVTVCPIPEAILRAYRRIFK